MSIYFIGAGSMGCLWAAHCVLEQNKTGASDQSDITFLSSRPSFQDTISFSLESPYLTEQNGSLNFEFHCASHTGLKENIEYIFVFTKSFDALSALKALSERITNNTIIVLFQNGLGSQFAIQEAFPNNAIFAAVTTEGANRPSKTKVIHAGKGETKIGSLDNTEKSLVALEKLKTLFKEKKLHQHLTISFVDNILEALWIKLAVNCSINPFTAILNCPNGEVKHSALFKETWPTLRSELALMLKYAEVFPEIDDLETHIQHIVYQVMDKTANNISSMLQDTRNGRKTEIADINGFAYKYLQKHDLPYQANKRLFEKVSSVSNS